MCVEKFLRKKSVAHTPVSTHTRCEQQMRPASTLAEWPLAHVSHQCLSSTNGRKHVPNQNPQQCRCLQSCSRMKHTQCAHICHKGNQGLAGENTLHANRFKHTEMMVGYALPANIQHVVCYKTAFDGWKEEMTAVMHASDICLHHAFTLTRACVVFIQEHIWAVWAVRDSRAWVNWV